MIADALTADLDHVAVAVPDLTAAEAWWHGDVGAGMVVREPNDGFEITQVRFAGGGKLELIAPPTDADEGNFVARFLDRFGSAVHHVTLKVDDLGTAIDTVRAGGYDVVDVQNTSPWWREGFLRPSQVGGLIVQIAWAAEDDDAWADRIGTEPRSPAPSAPRLHGPTVAHPDLSEAAAMWRLLGAEVTVGDDRLVCRWPGSALDVVVERGEPAGPTALRLTGDLDAAAATVGIPPLDVR